MQVHTSHLSLGKQVPRGKGVMFLDVTRKSGGPFAQQYLAPSWELLHAYKRRELTAEEYAVEYLQQLSQNRTPIVAQFTEIISRYNPTDLIVGCYCGHGEFCHRHLLQRWIVENVEGCIKGWELQAGNLYQGDEPVAKIISVAAPLADRRELLEFLRVELGSHILLGVDDDQATGEAVHDMTVQTDLSRQILAKAKTQLIRRQGPLVDLTEFGSLNAVSQAYSETPCKVVLPYSTELTVPWDLVQGDYNVCLAYIRSQRFAPTFEITTPPINEEFDNDMDRLYHHGLNYSKDQSYE